MEIKSLRPKAAALAALFISGSLAGGALKERDVAQAHAAELKAAAEAQAEKTKKQAEREAAQVLAEKEKAVQEARLTVTKDILNSFDAVEKDVLSIRSDFKKFAAPILVGGKRFDGLVGSDEYTKQVNGVRKTISYTFQKLGELRYALNQNDGKLTEPVVSASVNLAISYDQLLNEANTFISQMNSTDSKIHAFRLAFNHSIRNQKTAMSGK